MEIMIEDFETNVEFHVLDIPSSFNLLLGRPWLHRSDIMAVPSSLHQKVQLGLATGTLTIYGDSGIRPHVPDNAPLLEIAHGEEDITLGGFSFDTSDSVFTVKMDEDFSISSTALDMMLKMEYLPGLGLGSNNQGVAEFPKFLTNNHRFGLGYELIGNRSSHGRKERACAKKGHIQFIKAPEAIYQGDPEPFWDMEAKTKLPGFEIFADDTWESDDETKGWKAPAKIPHVDWIEVLDSGNLLSLFGEENPPGMGKDEPAAMFVGLKPVEDMELMMLGQEALEDVTALIIDAYGTYKNCTFVPKIIYTGTNSEFESESGTESESSIESEHESVIIPRHHFSFEFESTLMYHAPGAPFLAINEINFAYLAVSEINCVDPDDEEIEFEEEIPKELRSLIERENERHAQPIKEEVISINLKDENNPHMVQIGSGLTPEEFKAHSDLLKEFEDVFAWSHADMPGIDPEIVEHRIPLYPDAKPVKQKLRKMRPDWVLEIKKEVQRQIDAGFLMVTEYPQWVANIVPVPKKYGKIRVCVDFRDLNKASPKDDFPLPHIDVLVDNTAGHALLSFMDGFSGYNQILMAPEDREKTTFTTEWGTYCYRVMPFGLKNAGSTYQRAATTLLHDMIHKEVEVYVDDMIVKAKEREEHLPNLRKFFERIRKYRLRLNPEKCTFGVTAGKMLGFMITTRGIEVDPSKIEAILEMEPPRTEKEIRSFLGKIQFISRFIAKLTSTCEPMFRLLKKGVPFRWDDKCHKAFDAIKKYLQNPPVLMPPIPGQPLILYLSVTPSAMGCMLAQEGEGGSEKAVYYISKKMMGCEERYTRKSLLGTGLGFQKA